MKVQIVQMSALGALLCLFNIVTLTLGQNLTAVVDVPNLGKIQGRDAITSSSQTHYWTFHGIPYAETDSYTKTNRFQPSKLKTSPLTNDSTTFIANKVLVYCPQVELFNLDPDNEEIYVPPTLPEIYQKSYQKKRSLSAKLRSLPNVEERVRYLMDDSMEPMGQEDCLTISVNTPHIPKNPNNISELVPVVVFYHGGGSDSVWGSAFTGLRMLEHKVVLVTMNYRLGTLGALNLGINEAPGNAGQYDGVVALEWVQAYIKYFGGDPKRVTISGQSAGSMMVANLMVTPMTKDKDLFHRVWGFSGSALSVWATAEHPSLKHHLKVAEYAGCRVPADSTDMKKIATCMQTASLLQLVAAQTIHKTEEESIGHLGFDAKVPSIQAPGLNISYFMEKHPYEVLEAGEQRRVPVVFGSTRHDGSFPLDDIYNNFIKPQGLDKNETYLKNELLPYLLDSLGVKDPTGELYHAMGRAYLGDSAITGTMVDKLPGMLDMVTVMAFKAGMYETLRFQKKVNPHAYFYSLDYTGRWSLYNLLWGDMDIPGGICHTDDLIYFFWLGPLMNDDMKVSRRWMQYFIDFAYTGSPNGAAGLNGFWPPYDEINHPYLQLGRKDRPFNNTQHTWMGVAQELDWSKTDGSDPSTELPTTTETGPTVTGPTVTGPTVTGPTVTGPTVTGPTVTGPTVTGPTVTGSPTTETTGTGSRGQEASKYIIAVTSLFMIFIASM